MEQNNNILAGEQTVDSPYAKLFDEGNDAVMRGEDSELFTEQIAAMLTGKTLDGDEIPDADQRRYDMDYIVATMRDNDEAYADVGSAVVLSTIYGDVTLGTVSHENEGRYNLQPDQMTGRLPTGSESGFKKGQLVAFTAEEVMRVAIAGRDFDEDTSMINPAYGEMYREMHTADEPVTYRGYVDGDKSAFDVTIYQDEDGQRWFYVEDTAGYPEMKGKIPGRDASKPDAALALYALTMAGEHFDGKSEYVLFNIHEPSHTAEQFEHAKQKPTVVEEFRAKTDEVFHELNGENRESIEKYVKEKVEEALTTYEADAVVVDAVLYGSRCRGLEHETSDVDVVVEYIGSESEDGVFNILHDLDLHIGDTKIDINAITEGKTGTLETYLPKAEAYLAEKAVELNNLAQKQAQREAEELTQEDILRDLEVQENPGIQAQKIQQENAAKNKTAKYANFKLCKNSVSEKYLMYADAKYPNGEIVRGKPIAEFPNREAAIQFCKKNKVPYTDISNQLQTRIKNKKIQANQKSTAPPERSSTQERTKN